MNDTTPKPFVFVLMPFSSEFDDVYKHGIKPACLAAGAYCERVDEQIFQDSILDRVYNQISKADFLVADITGRNPNVFYETGYCHALGKKVILLTQKADDIPFDLRHYPHIVYGTSISTLKDELQRRLHWLIENPPVSGVLVASELEFYISGLSLSNHTEFPAWKAYGTFEYEFDLQIHNPSRQIFQGTRIRLALVTNENFWRYRPDVFLLPHGSFMYPLPSIQDIFPDGWINMNVRIDFSHYVEEGRFVDMTLRVFTEIGVREFLFRLRTEKEKPV